MGPECLISTGKKQNKTVIAVKIEVKQKKQPVFSSVGFNVQSDK